MTVRRAARLEIDDLNRGWFQVMNYKLPMVGCIVNIAGVIKTGMFDGCFRRALSGKCRSGLFSAHQYEMPPPDRFPENPMFDKIVGRSHSTIRHPLPTPDTFFACTNAK